MTLSDTMIRLLEAYVSVVANAGFLALKVAGIISFFKQDVKNLTDFLFGCPEFEEKVQFYFVQITNEKWSFYLDKWNPNLQLCQ